MTTTEARRSYTPPFSLALDDDDSGRSRRSKSTEDRMNGQREAPAHSSVYTGTSTPRHAPPSKPLRKAKATDDDIEDAAANDYDRALPLRVAPPIVRPRPQPRANQPQVGGHGQHGTHAGSKRREGAYTYVQARCNGVQES
ncbi:hypothetical protein BJ912DRAFT_1062422 [Pholiota molesta]|nr:hypothetical protein BJ912DRAFT_1062422 [Pholiota molesta]